MVWLNNCLEKHWVLSLRLPHQPYSIQDLHSHESVMRTHFQCSLPLSQDISPSRTLLVAKDLKAKTNKTVSIYLEKLAIEWIKGRSKDLER